MQNQNNKKIGVILTIVAVAIMAAGILGVIKSSQDDSRTIKIGAILPMTGTQAFAGEGMRNALEMALANLGQTKYKYELIVANNAFDVKSSISAANKLISVDKVDAIIDAYAPIGNAVSPITEKAHVVHIDIAFDPKIAEGDYNFLLFTTPDTAAKSLFAEMQKRGVRSIGVFRVNNQGIFSVFTALNKLADQYGIKVVADEMFQPGERDFKTLIAREALKKPDMYVLLALSPELEILGKQLLDQNIHNFTSTIYFELAKDKSFFEGLWSVGYGPISPDFVEQYTKKYGTGITFGVPNVYDAFNVIVRAAETNSEPSKPSAEYIAKQIQSIGEFNGVLGDLHVDSQGIIDTPTSIKVVKEGKMI